MVDQFVRTIFLLMVWQYIIIFFVKYRLGGQKESRVCQNEVLLNISDPQFLQLSSRGNIILSPRAIRMFFMPIVGHRRTFK